MIKSEIRKSNVMIWGSLLLSLLCFAANFFIQSRALHFASGYFLVFFVCVLVMRLLMRYLEI
jgi:hypothetical protein